MPTADLMAGHLTLPRFRSGGCYPPRMPGPREVEIKFVLQDVKDMERRLRRAGFRRKTQRTHEMNTLYDLPSGEMRSRGEVLRLREYGGHWTLTHKSRGRSGRHKTRIENETSVSNGAQTEAILVALGYRPTFRYEKYRTEWTDGSGHVVLDETPIGNFGEIEGPPSWIDHITHTLNIPKDPCCTQSYGQLFMDWKRRTRNSARNMMFEETGRKARGAKHKRTSAR